MQEAYRLQLRCFLGLVSEQRHLPSLKQLLRLYTAISLPKLASLMDMDEPTLRSQLMLLKVCDSAHAGHSFAAVARLMHARSVQAALAGSALSPQWPLCLSLQTEL